MKLTALATTAILAALATAAPTSTPDPARLPRPREWFARLRFRKSGGWYPSQKVLDNKIKADLGNDKYYDWSAEDWAAHILLQCKATPACKSCIGFLGMIVTCHSILPVHVQEKLIFCPVTPKERGKEPYWSGYLFAYDITENDFSLDTSGLVDRSIGYYNGFADREPLPPVIDSEEQHVLDL